MFTLLFLPLAFGYASAQIECGAGLGPAFLPAAEMCVDELRSKGDQTCFIDNKSSEYPPKMCHSDLGAYVYGVITNPDVQIASSSCAAVADGVQAIIDTCDPNHDEAVSGRGPSPENPDFQIELHG